MSTPKVRFAAPNCNIELKTRIEDLDAARETACQLATERLEDQHQIDTYFHCQRGRLKLREINGQRAELIWYDRPNQEDAKASNYAIIDVSDAKAVKRALSAALGVRAIIEKQREIFLHHNVRIHLDRVPSLGTFLEFEAVLGPGVSSDVGNDQVRVLTERFGIVTSDLIDRSYGEMVCEQLSNV